MLKSTTALYFSLLVSAGIPIAAMGQTRDFPVAAQPSLEDRFPVQPVAFPGGIKAYRDIVFQQLPGFTPQIVDIYVPATEGPHPLILYVHGGGWVAGHTRHSGALANFPAALASLAAEGFTVASVEYRLSGEAQFPAQIRDVNAALRFLRDHAKDYRIDPTRTGIWGGSAGGHLAALAATSCRDTTLDPAAGNDGCVAAAAIWYGVFDFAMTAAARPDTKATPVERLLGCEATCPAETYAKASPITHLDRRDPAFLLITGTEDKTVPAAQSRAAEARMKALGVPVESIYITGADHSFIGATPAATRDATLRATNATFDFFHDKLGVKRK